MAKAASWSLDFYDLSPLDSPPPSETTAGLLQQLFLRAGLQGACFISLRSSVYLSFFTTCTIGAVVLNCYRAGSYNI